jgi:hypothetical protein
MRRQQHDFSEPGRRTGSRLGSGLNHHRGIDDTGHAGLLVGKTDFFSLKETILGRVFATHQPVAHPVGISSSALEYPDRCSSCIASDAVEYKVWCFFERAVAGAVKNMSQFQLTAEILDRSVAQTWDEARREWSLYGIYEADEPETCLCGHFPIIEPCVLRNRHNGIQATVGNCCVKNFIGLPSDRIFQVIKRIRRDPSNSLNPEAIQHAFDRQWITEWERDFYFTIMRKRNLTQKQSTKKLQINEVVVFFPSFFSVFPPFSPV